MAASKQTRRRLFEAGAGALAAVTVAKAGGADLAAAAPTASASAGANPPNLPPGEVRLFAGNFVPQGWKLAPATGRGLMGSGAIPEGPTRHLGEKGDGAAVREADHGPSVLPLIYLVLADPQTAVQEMLGEVRAFPYNPPPKGWWSCDGRELKIGEHAALFSIIETAFGGDGKATFALPDLRGRTPIASGDAPGIPPAPFAAGRQNLAPGTSKRQPRLHVDYAISHSGPYPSRSR
jgi:microcystin-dependent protein